jgi:hypothetical protein
MSIRIAGYRVVVWKRSNGWVAEVTYGYHVPHDMTLSARTRWGLWRKLRRWQDSLDPSYVFDVAHPAEVRKAAQAALAVRDFREELGAIPESPPKATA